jgi:S-adenosylmethionine hydrolase
LAAELARGAIQAATLGPVTVQIVPSWVDEPQRSMDRVSGMVITVDHFGNLLTNIDRSFLEGIADPLVVAGHLSVPLRRTYGDVRPGEPIALVNSFDVVEIAVAEGRAAEVLGLSRGAPVTVRDAVRRA